jgi:hypothetical protein
MFLSTSVIICILCEQRGCLLDVHVLWACSQRLLVVLVPLELLSIVGGMYPRPSLVAVHWILFVGKLGSSPTTVLV